MRRFLRMLLQAAEPAPAAPGPKDGPGPASGPGPAAGPGKQAERAATSPPGSS